MSCNKAAHWAKSWSASLRPSFLALSLTRRAISIKCRTLLGLPARDSSINSRTSTGLVKFKGIPITLFYCKSRVIAHRSNLNTAFEFKLQSHTQMADIPKAMQKTIKLICSIVLLTISFISLSLASPPEKPLLLSEIQNYHFESLKQYGDSAIPPLLELYKEGNNDQKAKVAGALYYLSIKSEDAREVLMKDIHTSDSALRLQVQWAVGRVSNDEVVIRALLDNMRNDPNPVFRDKAACALAHDQPHLTEKQRVLLLEGLVQSLEDEKPDVRNIASLALQIQTGQNKGSVQAWKDWVAEYRRNIYGTL